MNEFIELMMNPFCLYSDYVLDIQLGNEEGPILSYEEWKRQVFEKEDEVTEN